MKNRQFVKLIILSALILCFCQSISAKKIAKFPGINEPYQFEVYDDFIYIGERSTISIYSIDDFTLIKKFGREGEGPGEFQPFPMLKVFPKYIVVNNLIKWLIFSRNGELIKEKRNSGIKFYLYPVGINYVALSPLPDHVNSVIKIYNEKLEPIKEISREVSTVKRKRRRSNMITDYYRHTVYDDKIFLGDTSKGFFIEVFDSKGNKLYEIRKKYQPIKVTEKYKKDELKREKEANDIVSNTRRKLKYKYVFKDHFPAFRDLRVKDGKIYIFTHKRKGDRGEIIVMDLVGKIKKRVFAPRVPLKYCSISNNRYYYLNDNLENEEWEMFSEDI
jgi:hypothetical protein